MRNRKTAWILAVGLGMTAFAGCGSEEMKNYEQAAQDLEAENFDAALQEYEAAIAYNKAADMLEPVFPVSYTRNYIEDISHITYAAAYNSVKISKRVIEYVKRLAEKVK